MTENIIKEIISIDNKAKENIKQIEEKNDNFEKLKNQEISIKEAVLLTQYKDELEKIQNEYSKKLASDKETIDNNMNAKIEMKKNKFNQVKEEKVQEIFGDIIKKVAGIC